MQTIDNIFYNYDIYSSFSATEEALPKSAQKRAERITSHVAANLKIKAFSSANSPRCASTFSHRLITCPTAGSVESPSFHEMTRRATAEEKIALEENFKRFPIRNKKSHSYLQL